MNKKPISLILASFITESSTVFIAQRKSSVLFNYSKVYLEIYYKISTEK